MILDRGGVTLHPRQSQPRFLKRILGQFLRAGAFSQMRAKGLPVPEISRHQVVIALGCGRCVHASMRDSGRADDPQVSRKKRSSKP